MFPLHQLGISGQHRHTVNHRLDAVTGDLLHIGNAAVVDFLPIGFLDGQRDRVIGIVLRIRRQFQQFLVLHTVGMNFSNGKGAFCQSAGLVEHNSFRVGQRLQVVAALDEYADLGRAANTAEEAERNRNHQRTGAGNDQEGQGPVNPNAERLPCHQRRQDSQGEGGEHHHWRIVSGKAGDEVFHLSLFIAGVLHKVKDFRNGGFPKCLSGLDGQDARLIDAPADNLHARLHLAGHRFAGQGRSVQRGAALDDLAVQWDTLTGLHDDGVTNLHVLRVYLYQLAALLNVGIVWANVHQAGNGAAGLGNSVGLEPLAYLIEQHHRHALGMFPQDQCADSRNRHKEVLVKHLTMQDVGDGFPDNIPADHRIADEIDPQLRPALRVEQAPGGEQHRRHDNAGQQMLLLFCHVDTLLPARTPATQGQPVFSHSYALTVTSGSIFLMSALASASTASNFSSGASSTIFWPRKLTATLVTPSIFWTAFWILSAQWPQSRSMSLMVFFIAASSFLC